jgi:ankyrin repeat protein
MSDKDFSEKSAGHSDSSTPKEFKVPADPSKAFGAALEAVKKGNTAFIRAYIDAGKDLNWRPGYSLLHEAMKREDLTMAELLIQNGVDPNVGVSIYHRDHERNASFCSGPLIGVLWNQWHSPEMLALLLNAKPKPADVNVRFKRGTDSYGSIDDTYIDDEPTLLYLMVSASRTFVNREKRLQMVEQLLKAGADPNLPTPKEGFNNTPLSAAIALRDTAMVELLLRYGAKVTEPYRIEPSREYAINTLVDNAQFYFESAKRENYPPIMISQSQRINELVQAAAAKQKKEESKPEPKQSNASSQSTVSSAPSLVPGQSAAALLNSLGAVQTASRQQSPQPKPVKKEETVVSQSSSSSSSPQGKMG